MAFLTFCGAFFKIKREIFFSFCVWVWKKSVFGFLFYTRKRFFGKTLKMFFDKIFFFCFAFFLKIFSFIFFFIFLSKRSLKMLSKRKKGVGAVNSKLNRKCGRVVGWCRCQNRCRWITNVVLWWCLNVILTRIETRIARVWVRRGA